jgi:hypothetical protein
MMHIVEIQTELRGQIYWISVAVSAGAPCPETTLCNTVGREVAMELGVPSRAGRSAR